MPPPDESQSDVSVFAETDFRESRVRFGIRQADRLAHTYVVGKTGTGKTTLLETLIRGDLEAGRGLALLDPHGDLLARVLRHVPEGRRGDVIHFDVPDLSRPLGFNPLEGLSAARRPLAAAGMLEVFRKIWSESWGPRLEHILRHALLALLDQPSATLADVPRLIEDARFRRSAMKNVASEQVRGFWLGEYARYPERFRVEAVAPVLNKVGAFLADPVLSGILTQPKSAFKLRTVMDAGKVLLVNLAKGGIGEGASSLLGSLLVSRMGLAALSRADLPEEERRDFHLYLDEFQTFTTLSLASMLSETRKYRLSLTLAHQYLAQLSDEVRDAVLGNAGTMICFRLGASDAEALGPEFAPEFAPSDLTNLPNYHVALKLMIDGQVSRPFSARTLAPA
jgi:hypothetical protein